MLGTAPHQYAAQFLLPHHHTGGLIPTQTEGGICGRIINQSLAGQETVETMLTMLLVTMVAMVGMLTVLWLCLP